MKIFKFFINYEKEEKWLQDMAKKGYELESIFLRYKFHSVPSESAIIRIDYRTFKNKKDFIDYCTLFEDCGWKHLAGTKYSGTQYFKKVCNDSEEDIFSDAISKAGKYKRLSEMWLTLAMCYLPLFVSLASTSAFKINTFLNPKLFYLTPGLWEKTGATFWAAFWFETPFALFRGIFWLIFPVCIILFLIFAYKAHKLYIETRERA